MNCIFISISETRIQDLNEYIKYSIDRHLCRSVEIAIFLVTIIITSVVPPEHPLHPSAYSCHTHIHTTTHLRALQRDIIELLGACASHRKWAIIIFRPSKPQSGPKLAGSLEQSCCRINPCWSPADPTVLGTGNSLRGWS